jgi:hypothetical protein
MNMTAIVNKVYDQVLTKSNPVTKWRGTISVGKFDGWFKSIIIMQGLVKFHLLLFLITAFVITYSNIATAIKFIRTLVRCQ